MYLLSIHLQNRYILLACNASINRQVFLKCEIFKNKTHHIVVSDRKEGNNSGGGVTGTHVVSVLQCPRSRPQISWAL